MRLDLKQEIILGIGKTGRAAQDFWGRLGVAVRLFDDFWEEYAWRPALETLDFDSVAAVMASPGIPFQHPVVLKAREKGVPIVSDLDLFRAAVGRAFFMGVTGTNGKSTTTALVHHLLKQVYPHVQLGGNIGVPVLDLPDGDAAMRQRVETWLASLRGESEEHPKATNWPRENLQKAIEAAQKSGVGQEGVPPVYVLELSSFQLAWSHNLGLDVALWTNLTPDHLDRHGSLEAYVEAKRKVFDGAGLAIIGVDDVPSRQTWKALKDRKRPVRGVSVLAPGKGDAESSDAFVDVDGVFHDKCQISSAGGTLNFSDFKNLVGRHNWQNMALATMMARQIGVAEDALREGLRTFQGLPHRLEEVGRTGGAEEEILFINDSKATNAESTSKALESFPDDVIYLIAGGRAKSDGLTPAVPFTKRVACVFLIGESADRFSKELGAEVPHMACGDLATALQEALKAAQQGETFGRRSLKEYRGRRVVLLSPACASFDQFRSYEDRGEVFKGLVQREIRREQERGGDAAV